MLKKLSILRLLAKRSLFVLPLLSAGVHAEAPGAGGSALLKVEAAVKSAAAIHAPILGAGRAGERIVAVGDHGTILLSDDGKRFRQAEAVPVSSTLAAVAFADHKNGWAVGHWGAILHTADGGEHWSVQRMDTHEDRPLFSVHFFDDNQGVAVGLWSLVLRTEDGGKTWQTVDLPAPPDGGKADRNLFRLFVSPKGSLFVAAERGIVLRSDDHGKNWHYINTGYKGSFWTGVALRNGTLLVAGLRGTIYRSVDDGLSWQVVNSGVKSSITDVVETGGRVVAVGLDGVQVESTDGGATFTATQRSDRLSMTALAVGSGADRLALFSKKGVVETPLPVTAKP